MTGIIKKIVNKKVGFTLIEIIIAVSMFSIVIIIALDSFIKVIQINRQTVQAQDLQNNIRFLYELMSKEIKMAQKGDGRCNSYFQRHINDSGSFSHASRVYSTVEYDGNSVLFFKNYHNQCVIYYLDTNNNRLKIKRWDLDNSREIGDVFVLPSEINVTNFSVDVTGDFESILHTPYSVVMYMDLSNQEWDPIKIGVQTAVTARYIE